MQHAWVSLALFCVAAGHLRGELLALKTDPVFGGNKSTQDPDFGGDKSTQDRSNQNNLREHRTVTMLMSGVLKEGRPANHTRSEGDPDVSQANHTRSEGDPAINETSEDAKPAKPVVVVLMWGETFRNGEQHSRRVGTPGTDRPQSLASRSQMENLVIPLKEHGYDVLCFLITQPLQPEARRNLTEWYKTCMPQAIQMSDIAKRDQHNAVCLYNQVIPPLQSRSVSLSSSIPYAKYFIIMKPDMILKKSLYSYWEISKDSIAFPFRMWCREDHVYTRRPEMCRTSKGNVECWRVPDRLIAMPRKAFAAVVKKKIEPSHKMYPNLLKEVDTNVTFWITEGHDTDSNKDWNPFYAIAGRTESRRDEQCGNRTTLKNPTVDSGVHSVHEIERLCESPEV